MIAAMLVVFVIGLRHRADPDHPAAIDNLTRNANDPMPRTSRFVLTLFARGHSAMALALAAGAALRGARVGHLPGTFERAGELAGMAVLLMMAGLKLQTLVRGSAQTNRSRLLPKWFRDATHPLVAKPTGALFGVGSKRRANSSHTEPRFRAAC